MTGIGYGAHEELMPDESILFSDSALNTTSKIDSQCNIIFDEHKIRYFDQDIHKRIYLLSNQSNNAVFYVFKKDDFDVKNNFSISIPTNQNNQHCNIKIIYPRNHNIKAETVVNETATTEIFNFSLMFGQTFWGGSVNDVTDKQGKSAGRFEFNIYSRYNHGFSIDLYGSDIGSSDKYYISHPTLKRTGWVFGGWSLHYLYRQILNDKNYLTYRLGINFGNASVGSNQSERITQTYRAAAIGFRYNYMLANVVRGF